MKIIFFSLCALSVFMDSSESRQEYLANPKTPVNQPQSESPNDVSSPPFTDYCAMLSQEIQGRKHAFLAGNLVYYVGGRYNCWNHVEDETLGLTHPFYHDLRGRGFGITTHKGSGTGHDFRGWEFYTQARVAYGAVIMNGKEYPYPVPVSMKWRPDKVMCEYNVNGKKIYEEKFAAKNDVICSVIRSEVPVTLRFDGRSLMIPKLSLTNTSKVLYKPADNTVHIIEGGTVTTHPVEDRTDMAEGKLIYDGMSTVLSSSKTLSVFSSKIDEQGQRLYSFEIPCDSKGSVLTWTMDDVYANALTRTREVLADPVSKLSEKTKYMNDLLNYQIPYFRCTDSDIVDIYYYLWSIYLMYYIDVDKGWERHPHTQTAVNNFLGMHRYDANFQIKVGAWTNDKDYYAYGNVLLWKLLLPYAKSGGRLPDNMGMAWYCPVWETAIEHVVGAWQIYQHTGDVQFLKDCYDDYFKPLFWNGAYDHWGAKYEAAEYLRQMAFITGHPEDADHWPEVMKVTSLKNWLNGMWEKNDVPDYFGAGEGPLGWSGFAFLRNSYFPTEWARRMTARWAMDPQKGFFWEIPLSTKALKDWDSISHNFTSTPDTNYYALIGMYKSNVGRNANICALAHLKKYNLNWGIPIAPEAWDIKPNPWGDQYSNFNAGKILLILEGIAGLDYSVPDDTFTVCDTMPGEWDFMKVMVPLDKDEKTYWVNVEVTKRDKSDGLTEKIITVSGNPQAILHIQPWLQEENLLNASDGYSEHPRGHIAYKFENTDHKTVKVLLGK